MSDNELIKKFLKNNEITKCKDDYGYDEIDDIDDIDEVSLVMEGVYKVNPVSKPFKRTKTYPIKIKKCICCKSEFETREFSATYTKCVSCRTLTNEEVKLTRFHDIVDVMKYSKSLKLIRSTYDINCDNIDKAIRLRKFIISLRPSTRIDSEIRKLKERKNKDAQDKKEHIKENKVNSWKDEINPTAMNTNTFKSNSNNYENIRDYQITPIVIKITSITNNRSIIYAAIEEGDNLMLPIGRRNNPLENYCIVKRCTKTKTWIPIYVHDKSAIEDLDFHINYGSDIQHHDIFKRINLK